VRVFEQGRYINDFCIVRAQDVPEADHYLTVFLTLLSDEESVLAVVQHYNIFEPYSEFQYGRGLPPDERETAPAVWRPRVA